MTNRLHIPILVPDMHSPEAVVPYLRQIEANRWYTNFGPLVLEFERRLFSIFPDTKTGLHLTTVGSGTMGLELALQSLDLPKGARVLIPALTFAATATAVLRAGLTPVISDIHPQSWLLTPSIATSALGTTRFDAVVPVASFGCPQPVVAWDEFVTRTGLPVVIDAAGALGNQSVGDTTVVVFSLHATKALAVGEGGVVISTDATRIRRIRQLSNFGIEQGTGQVWEPGCNAKMSEYHAAVGLAALERWAETCQRRRTLMADYLAVLRDASVPVTLPGRPATGIYTTFPVALPKSASVEKVARVLAEQGIQTRRWYYPPIHKHPAFGHLETTGTLNVTENLADRILGLPFHLQLTDMQLDYICVKLAEALEDGKDAASYR